MEKDKVEKFTVLELDIPDELFLQLAKLAHEKDITFNKMFELIIKTELAK